MTAPRIPLRLRAGSVGSRIRTLLEQDEGFLAQDVDTVLTRLAPIILLVGFCALIEPTLGPQSRNDALQKIAEDQRITLLDAIEELAVIARAELKKLKFGPLRLRNLSRPAVKLPPEILAYVFELVCLSDTDSARAPNTVGGADLRVARHKILSVCSRWLAVAFSTTSLWYRVSVTDTLAKPQPLTPIIAASEHAGNRALEIYLRTDSWVVNRPMVSRMLSQCGALTLVLRGDIERLGMFQPGTAMPSLHTLTLAWSARLRGATFDEIDLSHGSSLRSVTIHTLTGSTYGSLRAPQSRLRVPANCGIVKLSIMGMVAPEDVIRAINSCPHLETLRWHHTGRISDPQPLPALQCPPSLLHLSLTETSFPPFQHAELPRLARLDCPGASLKYLHVPKLQYLRAGNLFSNTDFALIQTIVPAFLHSHPHLEEVVLGGPRTTTTIIESLGGGRSVFPNLKHVWMQSQIDHPDDPSIHDAGHLLAQWDKHASTSMPFVLHLGGYQLSMIPAHPVVTVLESTYLDGGRAVFKVENYEDSFWGGPYLRELIIR